MTKNVAVWAAVAVALALGIAYVAWPGEPEITPPVRPPVDTHTTTRRVPPRPSRPVAVTSPADTAVQVPENPPLAPSRPASPRLRLMAANLTSGRAQNYNAGHGLRIMQGVSPDVVMIQEFNYRSNTGADLQAMADRVTGGPAFYYREAGAVVPNGIISRYPIRSSGEWDDPHVDNRDFAWACIDIPGPIDLWVVSVHLLTTKATERIQEARSLVAYVQSKVPAAAFLAIGGDFNTSTMNEACYATLNRMVVTAGPYPVDQRGNSHTNANRTKSYDGVLVDADLLRYQKPVVIGGGSFANGLVLDPRVFTPISALAPATAVDASAAAMQHMGVIRDFLLPLGR